ncbi:MAG: efflux RND transporter permease subunit [Firmicutes bacterium]|nr:efflux RND transporter permease subunit [Bacillota bacterium]
MTKICINRPVTTLMGVLIILLVGLIAYNSLEIAYFPSVNVPMIFVSTSYSGAGPEEMEELVTKPLEETIATLTGVKSIKSTSSVGSSSIFIEFVEGTDMDTTSQDLREKIDMVKGTLPDDAKDPNIMKMDPNEEGITIGVTSTKYDTDELYSFCDKNVKQYFEKIKNISSVDLSGGVNETVDITLDRNKLENYNISIDSIRQALSSDNNNTPAGTVQRGSSSMQLRAVGKFKSINDIKNTVVTTSGGNIISVGDIAEVKMAKEDREDLFLINGNPGIEIRLSKQSDANIVTVSDGVNETLEEMKSLYPELDFIMLSSTADYIKTSIKNVVETAFEAAIISFIILLIFLRDLRTSFIICISIPTSIMATYCMMYLRGMTLNVISTSGLVIGIGMLVDNSVVVLDNISSKHSQGLSPKKAAFEGTKEVSISIIASTLTNVAVFAPMLFLRDMIGQLLNNLAYTICFAMAASIFVALTVVPMAAALILKINDRKKDKKKNIFDKMGDGVGLFLDFVDRGYKFTLRRALKHKVITIVIVLVCFVGTLLTFNTLGTNLMAESDEASFSIDVDMPEGTAYEKVEEKYYEITECMGEIPEATDIYANIGGGSRMRGGNISINVELVDQKERSRSIDEITEEIEKRLSDVAGCEINVSSSSRAMGSFGGGSSLSFKVKGADNDTLKKISDELCEIIEGIDGASNVKSSFSDSVTEGNIVLNRAKAAKYGISVNDVANTVDTYVSGVKATEYKINGTEIDIELKYPEETTKYLKDLDNVMIRTSQGTKIPLREVADINMQESETAISREDQQRYVTISADFDGMDAGAVQNTVEDALKDYVFPDGYSYSFGGSMEQMRDAFSGLVKVLIVSVLLIYMILASQFESFVDPFVLMGALPISLTGGLFGLFVMSLSIDVFGILGFIMLVGMVVNNAIVLIDITKQLKKSRKISTEDALLEAGPSRIRAIMMTTLTTVISLIPMAMSGQTGMESMQTLAVVVIFGMSLSTLVTLVFVPVSYSLTDKIMNFIKNRLLKNRIYEGEDDVLE